MASTSKTVNVTIYPTPYAVQGIGGGTGPLGPTGPAGSTGRGFFSLNFTGNVTVNYGTSTTVTVDISSASNALSVGNTIKVSFPLLGNYLYGTITAYSGTSLTFTQISGTAQTGNQANSGTIIYDTIPTNSSIASQVAITTTNSMFDQYVVFAGSTGNQGLYIDKAGVTTSPGQLRYNPGSSKLYAATLNLEEVSGDNSLNISPLSVEAENYFYFIAQNGLYFKDPSLIQLGDVDSTNYGTVLEVKGNTSDGNIIKIRNLGSTYDTYFTVNRDSLAAMTHAVELNKSDGKILKLIYNDKISSGGTNVLLDVSSAGNFVVTPSGGTAFIIGDINVSGNYVGNVVNQINGLTSYINISAGENVSLGLSGNTLTISSTGGLISVVIDLNGQSGFI
jgi:hypothetical protein